MSSISPSDLGRLDRESGDPLYRQIADRLLRLIEDGVLVSGDMLPSTPELSRYFEVAPMTIREALNVLRGERRIVSEKGKGVYVDAPPPLRTAMRTINLRPDAQPSLLGAMPEVPRSDDVVAMLDEGVVRLVESERPRLGMPIANWLPGRTWLEVLHGDGASGVFALSRYPVPGVTDEHGGDQLVAEVERLRNLLEGIDEVRESLVARLPSGGEVQSLAIPRDQPVVVVRHQGYRGGAEMLRAETVSDGRITVELP